MNRRKFCQSAAFAMGVATLPAVSMAQTPTGNPGDPMTGDDPMAAAEYLSSLESTGYYPTLYAFYGYIHPDAEAVAPRGTVLGWYMEDFVPLGPQPAVATDVTYLDSWTWDVTGETYSNVAEVSYTQEFTNADTVNDVVRLVFHEGSWRWWFGRDAAWLEEQKLRFSLIENTPQEHSAPAGLSAVPAIDEALLEGLPATLEDSNFDGVYELQPTAGSFNPDGLRDPQQWLVYKKPDRVGSEFPLGEIVFGSVVESTSDAEDMMRFADQAQNAPPVEFVGWNTVPDSGPAWLQTENPGVDVVGTSYNMILVQNGSFLTIRMYSEESLIIVCDSLGPARP